MLFRAWPAPRCIRNRVWRDQLPAPQCMLSSADPLSILQPGASTCGRASAWQTRDNAPRHSLLGRRVATAAVGEGTGSKSASSGALDRARESLAKRRAGPTAGKRAPKSAPKGTRVRQADKPQQGTPYQGVKPVHFAGREEVQKVGAGRLSKVS